jgi:hypothetical protein
MQAVVAVSGAWSVRLNWMVMVIPNEKKPTETTRGRINLRCLEHGATFNSADRG